MTAPRVRKTHHKSRHGCTTCKERKVKCDEAKPRCRYCERKHLECIYPADRLKTSQGVSARPLAAKTIEISRQVSSAACQAQCGNTQFDLEDLHLLSLFHTEVCHSLDEDESQPLKWSVQARSDAFKEPVLLYAALAVSALYASRTNVPIATSKAIAHYNSAIQLMIQALPLVPEHRIASIFLAGILLCTYNFAGGPQPGEYLAFSDGSAAELLFLIKGVRSTFLSSPNKISALMTGVEDSSVLRNQSVWPAELVDAHGQLEVLAMWVANAGTSEVKTFSVAIDTLKSSFVESYLHRGASGKVVSHNVMKWLWFLEPAFTTLLQAADPFALVIFAHFDVLLKQLDHLWRFQGWATHIMTGIRVRLAHQHSHMLQWPSEKIEGPRTALLSTSR